MLAPLLALLALLAPASLANDAPVDYSGHKVITVIPKSDSDLQFIRSLREDYKVDLWNEPRVAEVPVMARLPPGALYGNVTGALSAGGLEYFVAIEDLQSTIVSEKILNSPARDRQDAAAAFDFGKYNTYTAIIDFLKSLSASYPAIATLDTIGKSYENRPIYVLKVTSGGVSGVKPAIMIECGIHAREWSSVAAGVYLANELVTKYGSDASITALVDKYEFYIVNEANPDGYIYTWEVDRLWRKTRSRSSIDWSGNCRGADANRNFDVEHCGVGTSRKPCDDTYCGDAPFSESESRALRDLMKQIGASRMKGYFTLHAFSQLWMTPYGTVKTLPPNYAELLRVGQIGSQALARRYGTQFRVGSIANIIYEATGSSADYAYINLGMHMAFALELRDTGRYGFFLPQPLILPTCEETFDGLQAAIEAL